MSDARKTQVRGSTLLLGGQAFAVAVNLVTQIVLVRYLSKTGFGTFAFALSVVAVAETIAAFGLRRGVVRFVPIYHERGDRERAAGALVFAVGTVTGLGLAVVLVIVGFGSALTGEVAGDAEASLVLAILILLAPIQALENLLDGAFAVFVRPRAILVRRYVYTPVVRLFVVGLLVATGAGVPFVAVGWVVAGLVGLVAYLALFAHVLRQHDLLALVRWWRLAFPVRELLRFTTPLLSNDVAGVLLTSGGAILIGIMAGAAEVADLRVVMPVALTLTYVLSAFGTLFVPLAARLYARDEQDSEIDRLYWQTAAWSAVFSFPVFALAFVFGEQVVTTLFGDAYASSGIILAVLVLGTFFTAATGPNGTLLSVYGKVRYLVWTNVAAVALNLLLAVVLIAAFDALGAAIATTATLVLLNAVRQLGLARTTPVRAVDRAYVSFYCVLALAVVALALVDAALTPTVAVALALVAAVSFVVFLFGRRRLEVDEMFPELSRIPLVGRLLSAPGGPS